MRDIIHENSAQGYTENRVNLTKVNVIMEKFIPNIKENESARLLDIFKDVASLTEILNVTPYTIHNARMWEFSKAIFYGKLTELREEVENLKASDTVNAVPLLKALDEILH